MPVDDATLYAAVARLNRIKASNQNRAREATPRGALSPECIQICQKKRRRLLPMFLAGSPASLAVELMVTGLPGNEERAEVIAGNSMGIPQYRGIPVNSAPATALESRNMMVLEYMFGHQ